MRVLPLLFATASAQMIGSFPAECALGLKLSMVFDLMNGTTVASTASTLGWTKEAKSDSYGEAAMAQIKKDIAAAISLIPSANLIEGLTATSGENFSYFSLPLAICDDKLASSQNAAIMALEMALMDANSTLRTSNVFWSYLRDNSTSFYNSQFVFQISWGGSAAKDVWTDEAEDEIRAALKAVANNSSRVVAPTFGGGYQFDFLGAFKASVEVAIDPQNDWPYTSDPTRFDVYNMIRSAILDPTSTLRTTDKYFKVWVSPTAGTTLKNSFALLQPLWLLLTGLIALA